MKANKKTLQLLALYAQLRLSEVHSIYRSTQLLLCSKRQLAPNPFMSNLKTSFSLLMFGEQHVMVTILKNDSEAASKRFVRHLNEFQNLLNELKPFCSVYDLERLQAVEVDLLRMRSVQFDINLIQSRVSASLGTFSDFTLIS